MRPILAFLMMTGLAMADETPAPAEAPAYALVSVDGNPVTYAATIDLSTPGRVAGQAPCNRYFGAVEGTLPAFRPTGIAATRMACDRLADEDAFFALLSAMTAAEVGADRIVLTGGGHEMVFAPRAD